MEHILKRIIIEVRFLAILKFKDKLYDYFQQIIEQYTRFGESKETFELVNDQAYKKIFCEVQRAGISMENVPDEKVFQAEANRLVDLIKELSPKKIFRLGVRSLLLTPVEGTAYKELIENFATNQLNMDNIILKTSLFDDFALRITGKDDDYKYSVLCGAVNREEIKRNHAKFDFDKDPDIAYFNDIDIYCENYEYSISLKKITDMFDLGIKIADDFFERNNELLKS